MLYKFDKKKLTYVPSYKTYVKMILISLLMGLIGFLYSHFTQIKSLNQIEYITEETKFLIINEKTQFTPEKLKEYILELNIKFPHIVYAQAKLESGNFKSKMFKENNNLFGMKVAKKRPTSNKGEQYGHAYFETWKDCVVDYAFYQAAYLHDVKTERQYFEYLRMNYAEDTLYVNKLKQIIKNEKGNLRK